MESIPATRRAAILIVLANPLAILPFLQLFSDHYLNNTNQRFHRKRGERAYQISSPSPIPPPRRSTDPRLASSFDGPINAVYTFPEVDSVFSIVPIIMVSPVTSQNYKICMLAHIYISFCI